jgi:hypothetical protein
MGTPDEDTYVWSHTLSTKHTTPTGSPNRKKRKRSPTVESGLSGVGGIPLQLFESSSGFCSWTKLVMGVLPRPESGRASIDWMKGSLELSFGYDLADKDGGIKFTNQLAFKTSDDQLSWTVSTWVGAPNDGTP